MDETERRRREILGDEKYEKRHGAPNRVLAITLAYLDQTYGIKKLYYPGSGLDIVPKNTLGIDRVVHLSLEECDYFSKFGEGIKIKGDFRNSGFPDNTFDATLIRRTPYKATKEGIPDFKRVTKKEGLIILETESADDIMGGGYWMLIDKFLDLKTIELPDMCEGIRTYINN